MVSVESRFSWAVVLVICLYMSRGILRTSLRILEESLLLMQRMKIGYDPESLNSVIGKILEHMQSAGMWSVL